tara:strand:- start:126 stop:512 length:387 start_codon:yes stop_codon:yes gene_type:complete
MNNLNNDILCHISFELNLNNLLNFSIINKNNYKIFDNIFYKNYALKQFSQDFWIKAYERPIIYSKPLNNIKLELIRIEQFQKSLDNLNLDRWTKKDFYNYWEMEKKYNEKHKDNYNIDYLFNNILNIL